MVIQAADIDEDGDLDLVTSSPLDHTVRIHWNRDGLASTFAEDDAMVVSDKVPVAGEICKCGCVCYLPLCGLNLTTSDTNRHFRYGFGWRLGHNYFFYGF